MRYQYSSSKSIESYVFTAKLNHFEKLFLQTAKNPQNIFKFHDSPLDVSQLAARSIHRLYFPTVSIKLLQRLTT